MMSTRCGEGGMDLVAPRRVERAHPPLIPAAIPAAQPLGQLA